MSSDLLLREICRDRLVVAIDPGKVSNRVWLTTGERGLIGEPVSLPVLRDGVDALARLIVSAGVEGAPVIGIEATGALHRAWAAEVERRWPGSLRLFAPSETQAARAQLGSRRFKTDDRDCAALVWLLRQGAGRVAAPSAVEALLGAVRHRRQLVDARRVAQQRLHDQLNALCPGLSAPAGHGRVLELENASGRAVLACAIDFAGRAPSVRSLRSRAPGRLTDANARFWSERWKRLLAPPGRRAAARAAPQSRRRALARPARGHRRARAPALRAARRHRRADPHDTARRRRRPRRRLRGALAADRALARSRTSLLSNRPRAGQLSVGVDHAPRAASAAKAFPNTATR